MRFLLPILFILSCSHPQDAAPSDMDAVKSHRDYLCATFDPATVERCDRITFVALMAAACGKEFGLNAYEKDLGVWHRDTSACYPEDSKSECSLDGYLSVLHAAVQRPELVSRMQSALESSEWICGEGPESVTSIRPLKSTIERMSGASMTEEADASITGFRGHLLASYLWLKRKVYGSNNLAEKAVLNGLHRDIPASPFLAALDADGVGAVENLMRFPAPYSQFWGSAPDSVIYAASVAIIEGR